MNSRARENSNLIKKFHERSENDVIRILGLHEELHDFTSFAPCTVGTSESLQPEFDDGGRRIGMVLVGRGCPPNATTARDDTMVARGRRTRGRRVSAMRLINNAPAIFNDNLGQGVSTSTTIGIIHRKRELISM